MEKFGSRWRNCHDILYLSIFRKSVAKIQVSLKFEKNNGIALEAGISWVQFPMVSIEFFIDIILPAALWRWCRLRPQKKWLARIFPEVVKAAGAYGWQRYHHHVPTVLKSGSLSLLEPSGPVQALTGIALPFYVNFITPQHRLVTAYRNMTIMAVASNIM
jgi:hypothetical protein